MQIIDGAATKVRLRLAYGPHTRRDGLPDQMCIKCGLGAHREYLSGMGLYSGEVRFFNEIAPLYELAPPASYFGLTQTDPAQGIVALEDLQARGVEFTRATRPLSVKLARAGLDALAALHSQSWGDDRPQRLGVELLLSDKDEPILRDFLAALPGAVRRTTRFRGPGSLLALVTLIASFVIAESDAESARPWLRDAHIAGESMQTGICSDFAHACAPVRVRSLLDHRWSSSMAGIGSVGISATAILAAESVGITSRASAASARSVPTSRRRKNTANGVINPRGSGSADPPSPELTAIANTPQAYWIVPGSSAATVAKYTGHAQAAGAIPVLTLYGIPHRDCGSFASGGFASAADYRAWIDGIAADLGASRAAVILEPDALAMADCLSADQRQERFDLIRYAVDTLTRNPATAVYIDGGHLRWHSPDEMAARLNQVGVDRARGFSLNTANFFTTEEEIGYGEAISGLTNGSHYVIDTSRNGAGPAPDSELNWCNPSGRALGTPPTAATAGAHADAYLWIKRPGESDGTCDRGEPQAGQFVNQYAIDLARNAGQ